MLQLYLIGSILSVGIFLYGAGWWTGLVEDMEEDNPGYPVLGPEQSAGVCVLLCFLLWPVGVLVVCRHYWNNRAN